MASQEPDKPTDQTPAETVPASAEAAGANKKKRRGAGKKKSGEAADSAADAGGQAASSSSSGSAFGITPADMTQEQVRRRRLA